MQKGAIDLDIARQTKKNKIAQEQTKTENDLEVLNQNKIKSNYLPKEYQAKINQANEDNFNPIPKGGNGVNSSAIIGANLDEVRQVKEKKIQVEQEIKSIENELNDLRRDNSNDPKIKELEQKQQELLAVKQKLDGFINTSQTPMFNYNLLPSAEAKATRSTEEATIKTLESIKEIDDYLDFLNGIYIDKKGIKGQKSWTPNSGFLNYIGDKIVGGQGASESVRRFNSLMTNLADKSYKLKVQGDFFAKSITNPSDFWTWSSQIKNDLERTKKALLSKINSEINQYSSTNPAFYDYITMKYPEIKLSKLPLGYN